MSRIRICGGNYTKITQGKHLIHSEDSIEFNSLKKIYEKGEQNGVLHGDFEERQVNNDEYIVSGEWLDKDGKPIDSSKSPHAKIGEKVYFRVKTQNLPINSPISFELMEYDGSLLLPLLGGKMIEVRPFDDYVPFFETNNTGNQKVMGFVDQKGEIVFGVTLTEDLSPFIDEDKGAFIELYFRCKYEGQKREVKLFPTSADNYLKVGYSDRTLFVVRAFDQYPLPEIYTATGETIIFAMDKAGKTKEDIDDPQKKLDDAVEGITKEIKEIIIEKAGEKIGGYIEGKLNELHYYLGAKELKAGKIVMNTGEIHTRKKAMYEYPIYNNEGTEQFTVHKASNFGYPLGNGKTATSKGINQLEYFSNKGIGKIPKMGKEIINVAGGLLSSLDDLNNFKELINMMSGGGPTKPGGIEGIVGSFVPTPIGFAIAVYETTIVAEGLRNIEHLQALVDEEMETIFFNAKNNGVAEVKSFLNTHWAKEKKISGIEVSLPILLKLLRGKVRKLEELKKLVDTTNPYNVETNQLFTRYFVLYREIENDDEKKQDLKGDNTYIEAVFTIN